MDRIELSQRVVDYARRKEIGDEAAPTEVPHLGVSRQFAPTQLRPVLYEPVLCVVLGGAKQAVFGDGAVVFRQGQSAVIGIDVATFSGVVEATPADPYVALALRLDAGLFRELAAEADVTADRDEDPAGIVAGPTDEALLSAIERLFELVDQPRSIPVLAPLLTREIHFRLLQARVGGLLRALSVGGSQAARVASAVRAIRDGFAEPLAIPDLARAAGMSLTTFHHHFRALTGTSPLQYQKRLRLMEARRLIAAGEAVTEAAFTVGYESPTQFSREFSRHFGGPPRSARAGTAAAEGAWPT